MVGFIMLGLIFGLAEFLAGKYNIRILLDLFSVRSSFRAIHGDEKFRKKCIIEGKALIALSIIVSFVKWLNV